VNRVGAELAQVALVFQLASEAQDQCLDSRGRPMNRVGDRRLIGPIDAVKSLSIRARDPALHGVETHTRAPRGGPQRRALTDQRHDVPPSGCPRVFFVMIEYSRCDRRAYGSCRSRGRQERAHRSLENPQNGFSTATTGHYDPCERRRSDRKALSRT